ncbi:hypothetical protein NN4_46890 [Nocardia ninae NBRC 108245]|uniref:Uncharacterized protein n=1 Tax=Nocardia ninae NBRC 108245 TaxID=1210091 RepID=A0A511MHL5_9NOCA|nr:hypothetical protein NN4_46890 [Nocardia ninae NBRC 108245]
MSRGGLEPVKWPVVVSHNRTVPWQGIVPESWLRDGEEFGSDGSEQFAIVHAVGRRRKTHGVESGFERVAELRGGEVVAMA